MRPTVAKATANAKFSAAAGVTAVALRKRSAERQWLAIQKS